MVGAAYPLIGLLGLGIGTIVRHGAAATGVVIGAVFVGAQALGALAHSLGAYAPIAIVSDSLSATKARRMRGLPCARALGRPGDARALRGGGGGGRGRAARTARRLAGTLDS